MQKTPAFLALTLVNVVFIFAFLSLLPMLTQAQCLMITWPSLPEEQRVQFYTLYSNDVRNPTSLTTEPASMAQLGLDFGQAQKLEVSATNATGEGPKSTPYMYAPPLPLPEQVGAPTVGECK